MSSKLILKKSSVLGKTPVTTDLEYGELALNYADGKLFYKTASNTIANFSVGGGGGGGGGFALTANQFVGDGQETDFTLSAAPSSIAYTVVTVGGVAQTRGSAYTVTGTTLTFTDPPAVGDEIEVLTIASATIAQGVPVGGAANSVLVKQSATDYDTAWSNQLTVSSISYSNQITSTVATGTAPFVVTSTTRVANLNVATAGTAESVAWTGITGKPTFATVATSGSYSDLINTPDFASPPAIGSISPNSGSFSSLSITSLGADLPLSTDTEGNVVGGAVLQASYGGTGKTSLRSALANLTGFASIETNNGTTTFTNTSHYYQRFTGTLNQTIKLPSTNTLSEGWGFKIVNASTGNLTVQTSTSAQIVTVPTNTTIFITALSIVSNLANSWGYEKVSDTSAEISSAITTHESAVDPHTQYQTSSETLVTVATATGDIHGIVDRTQSTISFNETTRELSIAPVSVSWTYYHTGTLNTVSTTKTITLTNTDGAKFVYIDASGNLNEHAIPDFAANVYIAYVYWNSTTGRAVIVGDERHGSKRDTTWHSAQHQNVGTVWRSGGDLSYTLNSDSAVNIGVGTPVNIADEDLLHSITHSATPTNNFEQILTGTASLEVIYLTSTAYTTTTTSTVPWLHSTNIAQYNLINAGSGSLATATEGKYITYWLLATNDLRAGRGSIKLVLGRQLNNTVDEAYAESFTEYGLSFAEQVFMYQIVVQYSSSYTNNAARIRLAGVRKILAKLATTSVAAAPAASHNALTGRSEQDAHPISAVTNLQSSLDAKQNTLVSGTSIKTVNTVSLLGSGDVAVQPTLVSGTSIKTVNSTSLLGSGDVAVQPTLVSGTSIKTVNSVSLLGSGDVAVQPTLVSGTSIKTVNSTSLLGSGDVAVQSTLVSGTNIKTVNSTSLLGSGNIAIPAYTGPTITVGTTAPVSPAVGDLWVDTN